MKNLGSTRMSQKARQINYKALFDQSSNPCAMLTPELTIVDANKAYLRVTGRQREDIIGQPMLVAVPGDTSQSAQLKTSLERVISQRLPDVLALLHYPMTSNSAAGMQKEDRYWSVINVPILDECGELAFILQNVFDVTALQRHKQALAAAPAPEVIEGVLFNYAEMAQGANAQLSAELCHLRELFEQAPGFVCVLKGPQHIFELANQAFSDLIGTGREILGRTVREALPEVAGQDFFELLDRVYATGEPYRGHAEKIVLQRRPEESPATLYVDFVYQPITDSNRSVVGIFVQGHDVTESYELQQKLSYQVTHDDLTGLVNRREFELRLATAIAKARRTRTQQSLLYIDLDQFKIVNDTCGHGAGDELLRRVGDLLGKGMPEGSTLARLGSDEFGMLLTNCPVNLAEELAEERRAAIAEAEFCWESLRFGLSVSVGVVPLDGSSVTLEDVLSTAGAACYLAKDQGRNRVHVYRTADAELSERRLEMDWLGRLRGAMQEDRLILYGQRIRALAGKGQRADRIEVLVRFQDVDGKLVEPKMFIPAAERYDLAPVVDRHVVRATLQHLASLLAKQCPCLIHSINLSGKTLSDEGFVSFIQAEIADRGVPAHLVCFEITETAAVANLTKAAKTMHELSRLGFKFALDDFGSGMSSFGYLKSLPVDFLKIDGRFVLDIVENPVDRAMVEAIAKIARVMGIETIAEYAESKAILDELAAIGVDFAQGYAVHRPEPLSGLLA